MKNDSAVGSQKTSAACASGLKNLKINDKTVNGLSSQATNGAVAVSEPAAGTATLIC